MVYINALHSELISLILVRVIASSFEDFFNAKMSSKIFNEASEDDDIYKNACLDKFSFISRKRLPTKAVLFLDRCLHCGNPESLFRQGLRQSLIVENIVLGEEYLTQAADKGHIGAQYVLGIILLSKGAEFTEKGVEIISNLKKSSLTRFQIKCYKDNLDSFFVKFWKGEDILFKANKDCFTLEDHDEDHVQSSKEGYESICDFEIGFAARNFVKFSF